MDNAAERLKGLEDEASKMADAKEKAFFYKDNIVKAMEELRQPTDELEVLIDKKLWPVPTYGDMLFEV